MYKNRDASQSLFFGGGGVEIGGIGRVDFMFLSSYCGRVRHFTRSNDCVERILKDFSCNKLVFFPNHKPLSIYIWF